MIGRSSCCVFCLMLVCFHTFSQLKVQTALCENRINPSGLTTDKPRFSWELVDTTRGQYQTAYQVGLSSSLKNLQSNRFDVYSTGVVHSSQNIFIRYAGKTLPSGCLLYWKVRVWGKHNVVSDWTVPQQFITGLFSPKDWKKAKWISFAHLPDSMRVAPGVHQPDAVTLRDKARERPVTPLFRKGFQVRQPIASALLFVSGLGQYHAYLNGQQVGDAFLSPGWTYYDKTILYDTYDVSQLVAQGNNVFSAIVGNGFYNINRERYFKIVTTFGDPKMICLLLVKYQDGSSDTIASDETWKTTASSITFNSIYGGEDDDARSRQEHWTDTAFNDSAWNWALEEKNPNAKLLPEHDYPVTVMDSFAPVRIFQPQPGIFIYDFGQNASGIVALTTKGRKGQVIRMTPCELLNKDERANQKASGSPFYYSYTLSGVGEETWQPQFSFYGFRYVQVEGAVPVTLSTNDSTAKVLRLTFLHTRNSSPPNGSFECSNLLFNRIFSLINWAIKSNMQSVITDCPHREKLSWLEQDYLMGGSIHYNFDVCGLYRQLVMNIMDAQYANGMIPDIAPEYVVFENGFQDSPEWGSSGVILPWLLYTWYGDRDMLAMAYPMMTKYVHYLSGKAQNNILDYGLGDWYDYGPKPPGEAQLTPKALTATAIYFYDVMLLSKVAEVLHRSTDASRYKSLAQHIQHAFNGRFYESSSGVYATGSQTSMAMPLSVGLVAQGNRQKVLNNLIDSIVAGNKALTAGDIGFHFLVDALEQGGASQLVFDMNNRDDVPGYGFQLKKGATSLTESWPALEEVSNNHLMLGHLMEWLYRAVAGIAPAPCSIAYKHVLIQPHAVGDITFAKGKFHSPYGWITTEWKKDSNSFWLQAHIPVNATASVKLPVHGKKRLYMNGALLTRQEQPTAIVSIASGDYVFEVK